MKQNTIVFFLICVFTLTGLMTLPALDVSAQSDADLKTKIAAINGIPISKKDFIWAYSSQEQQLISKGEILNEDEVRDLKKTTMDNLINREILFQESQKKKIHVSESKVEEEYGKVRDSMMSDIDFKTIEKELAMQEKDIKNEFRRVFAIEMLLDQELTIDDTVTEKEAKDFFEKNPDKFIAKGPVRLSHILIKVEDGTNDAEKAGSRKKIEDIAEKLKKGEDFALLAKSSSEDESSRVSDGDIGWVKVGRTVKSFEDAAFALNPGQVSGIVETPYGYHLIKMLEKSPETAFSYEDMKGKIVEHLKNEKINKCHNDYIEKIKKSSKIEQFIDPVQIQ